MKKIWTTALVLCALPGAPAMHQALMPRAEEGTAGSIGSDGDGDHMAPGEVQNKDPVTNFGQGMEDKATLDEEQAAKGGS